MLAGNSPPIESNTNVGSNSLIALASYSLKSAAVVSKTTSPPYFFNSLTYSALLTKLIVLIPSSLANLTKH